MFARFLFFILNLLTSYQVHHMKSFYKKCSFYSLLFFGVSFTAIAQKKTLHGIIQDKVNQQPVGMVSIRNVINGSIVISKNDGSYITDVSPGNILAFTANGYYTDTITVTGVILQSGNLNIELKPLPSTLEDVTITSSYNLYQNDSVERRKAFLETVGENKIPSVSRPNDNKDFGVAINLDHFSNKEKNKRKALSLFEITEEEAYINYRWNETVVEKYTHFSNDELTAFMQRSRPAYDWLRNHPSEEDLLYYINNQLKKNKKS